LNELYYPGRSKEYHYWASPIPYRQVPQGFVRELAISSLMKRIKKLQKLFAWSTVSKAIKLFFFCLSRIALDCLLLETTGRIYTSFLGFFILFIFGPGTKFPLLSFSIFRSLF
jgi:hypothetical protein